MNRSSILEMLRSRPGQLVSGVELGKQLNISRVAVSKQIQRLRKEGYDIESTASMGHCLKRLPDLLRPEEVYPRLTTKILGREICYFSSIASTNDEAKKRAMAGCPEGTLVITEMQLGGRGRLSRGWFSPMAKGIWFSIVLRPPFPPQEAPKCTLMAAVAVNRAIREVAGIFCGIKWPNDILCNGRKLVGILTEMSAEMDAINHIVIGVGINVNIDPSEIPVELKATATSVSMEAGFEISRIDLFAKVLEKMEELYLQVKSEGFSSVLEAWRQESVTLGRMVNVIGFDKSFVGKAVDIDAEGALLVETEQGVERVLAGDVSIRPMTDCK